MEGDTIDLTHLENLPVPALINVLQSLNPESLIEACRSSKKIRSYCEYIWKDLFKRDITSVDICENLDADLGPLDVNWEKFYKIAMSRIPLYTIYTRDLVNDTYEDVFNEIIGFTALLDYVGGFLEGKGISKKRIYNEIKSRKSKNLFPINLNFEFGDLTIRKIDNAVLVRDIIMQLVKEIKTRELQNEIHLYKYDIDSNISVENLSERVNLRRTITESEDYILGEEEDTVLWRLVRILIDDHNISRKQAEDIVHEYRDEILSSSEEVEIYDEDESIGVRIKRQNIGIIEPETVLEYGVKICKSVNRLQKPRKPKSVRKQRSSRKTKSVKKQRKPRRK